MFNQFSGALIGSGLDTYKTTIARLEAEGYACAAWNVNGTGDVRIVYGAALETEWMVSMASKNATLIY